MAEPNNTDAHESLKRLMNALREDDTLRTALLEHVRDVLGPTPQAQPAAAGDATVVATQEAAKARRLAAVLRRDMREQRRKHERAKWTTGVVGLFAVLMGIVLFTLVVMMAFDMNRMEAYMYNMGHAEPDGKVAAKDKRKSGEPSYMFTMARDMNQMRADMASMNVQMTAMRGDMGQMRGAIIDMDGTMSSMGNDISRMSTDMTTMNGTMGRMQYDTLLMRQGVGNMATDTGNMSVPFRAMDHFIPFR